MVLYHQNRIQHNYIPNLRASFKAYDAARTRNGINTPENDLVSDLTRSDLRTLLFDPIIDDTSTLEKHMRLVIASYNLRRSRNIEEVLYSSPSATSKSKSLWLDICMLARLRVAFQNFKDITFTLPSFKQVTIILVLRPLAPANPSERPLNLKQTLGILQLDLSPVTTKAILGQNWTVAKIEREFTRQQMQKLNVHAEVQMLIFLNTNESSTSDLFPYFGCSKLSCFMCDRFIQSYGRFTTRGCHGRLFRPWTVPSMDRLLPGQSDRIAKALIFMQKEIKKTLMASVERPIRHERTSVIGGSSVLDGRQEEHSQRQLQIERLRMKAERDRVAEIFRR
jgi:OTT_1508-like deaminase